MLHRYDACGRTRWLALTCILTAPNRQHDMAVGRDVRGGELIMASHPLAVVFANPGQV